MTVEGPPLFKPCRRAPSTLAAQPIPGEFCAGDMAEVVLSDESNGNSVPGPKGIGKA